MRTKRINGKDIPITYAAKKRRPRKIEDPAKLALEYETHTAQQLADKYNTSLSTIRRYLRDYREVGERYEQQ